VSGQDPEDYIIENYYKLTSKHFEFKKEVFNKDQLATLNSIISDTNTYFCADTDEIAELIKNFYFIDLDDDNDQDLVFNGFQCSGFESESVIVFINIDGNYNKTLIVRGRILSFTKARELNIFAYPCCAETQNIITNYEIVPNTLYKRFGLTFFDSPLLNQNKSYQNIMPPVLKKDGKCNIISGAQVNYTPQDTLFRSTYIESNLIYETKSIETATVFAKYSGSDGSIWLYCKIPGETNNDERKNYILAWVNSKYCR